jgi:hypothetical protein
MIVHEIKNPHLMAYLSVEQTIRKNGERHLANAVSYASKNLPTHSEGSLCKAKKNFRRADVLRGPSMPDFVKAAYDIMLRRVSENLFGK